MSTTGELSEKLAKCATSTLASVLLRRGLANVVMRGVQPMPGTAPRVAGPAYTMRSVPMREDKSAADTTLPLGSNIQRRAAEECGVGEMLVIDCREDASAASGGMMLMERMRLRGCAGVVTDGGMRDTHELAEVGFPVYAAGPTPTSSLVSHRFIELNTPVSCGGVAVYPGDYIVGDPEGVVVVPKELADEVADVALRTEDKEAFILRRLREGAPLFGTYPLAGEGLAEYERQAGITPSAG